MYLECIGTLAAAGINNAGDDWDEHAFAGAQHLFAVLLRAAYAGHNDGPCTVTYGLCANGDYACFAVRRD